MFRPAPSLARYLLPVAVAVMPVLWLIVSLQTYRAMNEQRIVTLRHRAAMVAARLETAAGDAARVQEALADQEPALVGLELFPTPGGQPELNALWEGRELFRTAIVRGAGGNVFRTLVPVHRSGMMQIAQIDLDASVADYLITHARNGLGIAVAGSALWVALAVYALRAHRREAELAHMAQLGKMSAVLAHEIRNPLGTIKGFAQLIGERAAAERDFVDAILAETTRLEHLVQDLLLYGRPPAPRLRACAWNDIRASLLTRLRPDVQVQVHCALHPACWQTDPDLLLQSLVNLSQNAIEAIPAGRNGEVQIQVAAEAPTGVTITITDNGEGVGDDARPRLFEPFFTTKATGTGLGLVITRRLAASLGGSLEIAPAEDGGTRATLHFPQAHVTVGETVCNAS